MRRRILGHIRAIAGGANWDVTGASFVRSFTVTPSTGVITEVRFKPDLTQMYVADYSDQKVYSYLLSTAGDISTATSNNNFNFGLNMEGLYISPDGIYVFVVSTNGNIHRRTMSVAWDISTCGVASTVNIAAEFSNVGCIWFKPDGLRFYINGYEPDKIFEYSLSVAWDLTTRTKISEFNTSSWSIVTTSIQVNDNGKQIVFADFINDDVVSLTLGTAWDLTTASYDVEVNVNAKETQLRSVYISEDFTKMYICGDASNKVHEYDL
jgi:hypothetical protein